MNFVGDRLEYETLQTYIENQILMTQPFMTVIWKNIQKWTSQN